MPALAPDLAPALVSCEGCCSQGTARLSSAPVGRRAGIHTEERHNLRRLHSSTLEHRSFENSASRSAWPPGSTKPAHWQRLSGATINWRMTAPARRTTTRLATAHDAVRRGVSVRFRFLSLGAIARHGSLLIRGVNRGARCGGVCVPMRAMVLRSGPSARSSVLLSDELLLGRRWLPGFRPVE